MHTPSYKCTRLAQDKTTQTVTENGSSYYERKSRDSCFVNNRVGEKECTSRLPGYNLAQQKKLRCAQGVRWGRGYTYNVAWLLLLETQRREGLQMNSSRDSSETQQSYFYVVWPDSEDKSPGGTGTAGTVLPAATPAAVSSSIEVPNFSYDSAQTLTSKSNEGSSGTQQESPPRTPPRSPSAKEETGSMASLQVNRSSSPTAKTDANLATNGTPQSQLLQHVQAAAIPYTVAVPSLDSNSIRRQKAESSAKRRFRGTPGNSAAESNMREIGTCIWCMLLRIDGLI